MKTFTASALILSATLLTSPTQGECSDTFVKVAAADLPTIALDGSLKDFDTALSRQMDSCKKQDLNAKMTFAGRTVTRQEWCLDAIAEMRKLVQSSKTFDEVFQKAKARFSWYQQTGQDGHGTMQFTGYNSPTLTGSLKPQKPYLFPLYKKPADLVQVTENGKSVWKRKLADGSFVPYYTRKEIDKNGVLKGQKLEIGYVDDLLSVTILQVEGAGFLIAKNAQGKKVKLHLNYAAQNGYPLTSPRKILKAQGVADEYLTIPGMRRYFKLHPEQLESVLFQNDSYVFFETDSVPSIGVDDIYLTPLHSLAADLTIFPVGALTFISTEKPVAPSPPNPNVDVASWQPFSRLAVVQDKGGSIIGGHIDVYWGEDDYAELASGTMNQKGTAFVALLPQK